MANKKKTPEVNIIHSGEINENNNETKPVTVIENPFAKDPAVPVVLTTTEANDQTHNKENVIMDEKDKKNNPKPAEPEPEDKVLAAINKINENVNQVSQKIDKQSEEIKKINDACAKLQKEVDAQSAEIKKQQGELEDQKKKTEDLSKKVDDVKNQKAEEKSVAKDPAFWVAVGASVLAGIAIIAPFVGPMIGGSSTEG